MRIVLILSILLIVDSQIIHQEKNVTENEKFILDYKDKICKSQNTCHLVSMVSGPLQTLKERNCMCDASCSLYGDCCEDSVHVSRNNTNVLANFHCPSAERVYMKVSCPVDYPNQSVKLKCESSKDDSLRDENKKLFIPVTNIHKNITYGNEYCAVCNGEYVYQPWNLTVRCSPILQPQTNSSDGTQEPSTVSPTTTTKFVDYYQLHMEEAKKRIQFNSINKTFFSVYNGQRYDCWYTREKPSLLEPHFRDCVAVISNCTSKNSTLIQLCESHTSIVFYEFVAAYKNKYCAYCNGVTENLRGCLYPDTRITGSSLFTTSDKSSGQKPPCNDAKLKDKFC